MSVTSAPIAGADISTDVMLPSGAVVTATGRVYGPSQGPMAVALGGISAHRHLAPAPGQDGWWTQHVGHGCAFDTQRWRVMSMDFLAEDAAIPSTRDQAIAVAALCDALDVQRVRVIGASYGGMVALAMAATYPERVDKAAVISAADKPSAMALAWRSIQRAIIAMGEDLGDPRAGIAMARRLAMTTYRTPREFETRFQSAAEIDAYLAARGDAFASVMSPARYQALSLSLDTHHVDMTDIACPLAMLAVREDLLVPYEHMQSAAQRAPDASITPLSSLYGHDAFLKEDAAVGAFITACLAD